MLKSPHSLDPLASWVTCVWLCASCPPHVGLTDHTWRAAFHMFTSCPTHVRSLASPFIDLYRSNTIISLAIYNPAEFNIPEEKKPENNWGANWNDQDDQDSYNHFNDENACNAPQYTADQPGTDTPEWIDWVFAHINLDQIREIAGQLFSQNFRANYEAEHGIPFRVATPEPSIPELEEEPTEEAPDQWEVGSNDEIPRLGNFE
jgi:hypothetical protein